MMTPKIIVDYIGAGLTSVYQTPDVTINKPLKNKIREQYEKVIYSDGFDGKSKISVSREQLVSIIEDAYAQINQENLHKPYIRESFDICGLNPWSTDTSMFDMHLSNLSENSIYRALLMKHMDCEVHKMGK